MPRILLADDHLILRLRVREMLEGEEGWEVCAEAANGGEAVAMTEATQPDIVVLDLYMPEMDGSEAARQIHERFPQTAIVILSMHDTTELMDSLTLSGVRACVSKIDLPQLVETIYSVWEQMCYKHGILELNPPRSSGFGCTLYHGADTRRKRRETPSLLASALHCWPFRHLRWLRQGWR